MERIKDQARRDRYDSPEFRACEIQAEKILCQSGEAPDFGEGWSIPC